MRTTFAPPSSLARSLIPILKPRRAVISESNFVEMRECLICAESKPSPRKFPALPSCDHDANTCIDCYVQQAVVLIEQHRRWSAVTCPTCNVVPPASDLAIILPRHEFTRLDELVKKAALRDDPGWRWCFASGCGHGQIHATPVDSQPIRCARCNAKSCFHHQVKWHQGYTCDEYDESHPQSDITRTDDDTIRRITKACPNCAWRIQKEGGCSHMVCPKCHCTFFWNRLTFDGEKQASSAEYRGGPAVSFPALDEEVEDAIMRMEGTATFANIFERRVPQLVTPTPAIFHQRFHQRPIPRPVTGGLGLPTTEAPTPPPVATSTFSSFTRPTFTRPTPRTRAIAARRGAVDLTAESRSRSESTAPRPAGLRRSPRLHNLSGDPEEQLRDLGERMLHVDRADMEERRARRRALRAQHGGDTDTSDDEMIDEDAILNDPMGEYERRHEQRLAERAAAPVWPPRFDSLSFDGIRPSLARAIEVDRRHRSAAEESDVTRQPPSPRTDSPSFRYGHQRHVAISPRTQQPLLPSAGSSYYRDIHLMHGTISPQTQDRVVESREQQGRRSEVDSFMGRMTAIENRAFSRRMELEAAETSMRMYSQAPASQAAAPQRTPSIFRRNNPPRVLVQPEEDLITEQSTPHSSVQVRSPTQRLRSLLPRSIW